MMLVQSIILLALATRLFEAADVGHGFSVIKTGCSINGTLVRLQEALERIEENQCGVELKIDDIYTRLGRVDGRQCSADSKLPDVDNKLGKLEKKLCSVNSTVVDLTKQLDMVNQKQDSMDMKLEVINNTIAVLAENLEGMELKLEDVAGKQVAMEEKLEEMHTLLKEIGNPVGSYANCADVLAKGMTKSGVYKISPDGGPPFMVFCDNDFNGGGWTVFQRREMNGTDFYRVWSEYKNGFGELEGDHWLGNEHLHRLTKNRNQEITVCIQYPRGEIESARYSSFAIESEANMYRLKISGFHGDTPPGDSMIGTHSLNNMYFSTKDRDNDANSGHCAQFHHGAWWYRDCTWSNLNGGWGQSGEKAVFWYTWNNRTPVLTTTMLLR